MPNDEANARRTADIIKPICADREFGKLVTPDKHEFIYCGICLRRNAYLYRLECRPVHKFNRTGLGWLASAASDQLTHEVWVTYQRRQKNAPVRLLFRHQYDFGLALYDEIPQETPLQLAFGRYSEAFNKISKAAGYVSGSLAFTLNSIWGDKWRYLERRALSELLPDHELTSSDYAAVLGRLKAEHQQLDYYWGLQAQHAFVRFHDADAAAEGVLTL